MKNVYIEKMRLVMSSYWELQKLTNTEMQTNIETFSAANAERNNKELSEKKEKDFADAKAEIQKIFAEVRGLLAKSTFPLQEDITAEVQFLTNPYIKMTDAEIEALASEYAESGNQTMLRIISGWCEENGKYDLNLFSPKEQIICYKNLADAALFTINNIHSETKNHFIDLEIESFADPVMCKNELEKIGSGEGLKRYESKTVPEQIVHCFDTVTLKD